ncbi:MAG: DUF309 domain-containing protein [Acidobacteriia bacterium]|nr:DUF309 domain-containing protein [Terriglobia bacterium]
MKATSPDFQKALAHGLRLFNAGNFFEAHEVWEEIWRKADPLEKLWLQGLIQTAVGFHHLQNHNRRGARSLLRNAIEKLSRADRPNFPFDLPPLLTDLRRILLVLENESSPLPKKLPILKMHRPR